MRSTITFLLVLSAIFSAQGQTENDTVHNSRQDVFAVHIPRLKAFAEKNGWKIDYEMDQETVIAKKGVRIGVGTYGPADQIELTIDCRNNWAIVDSIRMELKAKGIPYRPEDFKSALEWRFYTKYYRYYIPVILRKL